MMDCRGTSWTVSKQPSRHARPRGITRGGEPGRPYEDAVRMWDTTGSATVLWTRAIRH
jgi:hypothetical protein